LEIDRAGPIAAAALFAACLPWLVLADQNGKIHTPRILSFLGDASYSIYLVHALPLLLLWHLAGEASWMVILPAVALIGLGAGIAYHLLCERPLLTLFQKTCVT
jgi:peptidoglycan/LPS O-acetylase OafA/YrhL